MAKLVSLAKQRALGVIGKIENTAAWLDIIEQFDLFSDDEDAGTCPSKYARQEWQQEQERNLCYVAATRAMASLVEVYAPHDIDSV